MVEEHADKEGRQGVKRNRGRGDRREAGEEEQGCRTGRREVVKGHVGSTLSRSCSCEMVPFRSSTKVAVFSRLGTFIRVVEAEGLNVQSVCVAPGVWRWRGPALSLHK